MGGTRDVDYLLAALAGGPSPVQRALIYRYRSGVLRPRVTSVLREAAEQQGRLLVSGALPLPAGFAEGGLFDSLTLYAWPARPTRSLNAGALEASLALLAGSAHRPSVHFVPHDSTIIGYQGWRAVERSALVLEEPLITHESLLPVLRYLSASTDLARGADFLAQPGFVESFADLAEEDASLPEIIQAFNERVLLCTDPATNRFDATLHRREAVRRSGRRALLPHLRDLAALRREGDLVDLLCGFDERRAERGWTAFDLVTDLYRMSGKLLEPVINLDRPSSGPRSRVAARRVEEGVLLWAALVLAWEEGLSRSVREETDGYRRGPDLLVAALTALGRDFLTRESRTEAGDPLTGRWSAIARTLGRCGADDRLAAARGKLVCGLAAALLRSRGGTHDWMRRLHAQALTSVGRVEPCACRNEKPAETKTHLPSPRTFETVIGRKHAAAALRRHACRQDAGVDLLLYGPDGVGKQTLARVYAQAVLCDTPLPGGSACGTCGACRNFDNGYPGHFELDGANKNIKGITEQLVNAIRYSLWSDRCVVVIRNADSYPPAVFDALLKPIENSVRTWFVLLARHRDDVRVAGQSRCFDYRLRPLNRPEAKAFLREIFTARGLVCDEATLALLMDASGGLPGRLHEIGRIAAGTMPASFEAIRTRLDLNWAKDLVSLWPEIVAGTDSALPGLMRSAVTDRAEAVRRVQALLQLIGLRGVQKASHSLDAIDPALRHLDAHSGAWLAAAIDRKAIQDGTIFEDTWTRMAERWTSDRFLNY